ncbi:unnamed protein product [Caenorhabditis sp. 36 PRJEB53466]|nr:unnamed protein product [Caenorhabditis sp. 36 PRJEB53466]
MITMQVLSIFSMLVLPVLLLVQCKSKQRKEDKSRSLSTFSDSCSDPDRDSAQGTERSNSKGVTPQQKTPDLLFPISSTHLARAPPPPRPPPKPEPVVAPRAPEKDAAHKSRRKAKPRKRASDANAHKRTTLLQKLTNKMARRKTDGDEAAAAEGCSTAKEHDGSNIDEKWRKLLAQPELSAISPSDKDNKRSQSTLNSYFESQNDDDTLRCVKSIGK